MIYKILFKHVSIIFWFIINVLGVLILRLYHVYDIDSIIAVSYPLFVLELQ